MQLVTDLAIARFDQRPTAVEPVSGSFFGEFFFPKHVSLCRAVGSASRDKLAVLVHGLSRNEDYFALLAPYLLDRGFDVWAIRLPGYVSADEQPSLFPPGLNLSLDWYAWVVMSALTHLQRRLERRPAYTLCWGHSMGAATLLRMANNHEEAATSVDRFVLEAPAIGEATSAFLTMLAANAFVPEDLLGNVARLLLVDDLDANDYTRSYLDGLVPGYCSVSVFGMSLLALISPLNRFPKEPQAWLDRCRFALARYDRLVEFARLSDVLDRHNVPAEHRLVIRRNHCLSLTCPGELAAWAIEHSADDQLNSAKLSLGL